MKKFFKILLLLALVWITTFIGYLLKPWGLWTAFITDLVLLFTIFLVAVGDIWSD
jgi:hypothetical protein